MAETPVQQVESAVAAVSATASKVATEVSFVRANWVKLSIILIAVAVVSNLVGVFLHV